MADTSVKPINDPFSFLDKIEEIGKHEKTVKLNDDFSILLSTISADEEAQIFKNCANYEGSEYITRSKIETLVFAIKGVNDNKFNYDEIENEEERSKERNTAINELRKRIAKWRDEVITYLYQEWLELTKNSEEQLKKIGIMAKAETKKKLDELETDAEEDKSKNKKEEEKQDTDKK